MTLNMKIVPLNRRAGYLEARELVAAKNMKLASHVLHDDYLAGGHMPDEVHAIYPAWAREILVYPQEKGRFTKGKDVVDSETGWVVPGSLLTDPRFINADAFMKSFNLLLELGLIDSGLKGIAPPDLLFMERTGLLIDPGDFDTNNKGNTVIVPESIVLLYPFIQESSGYSGFGKTDEITRVPLDLALHNEQGDKQLYRIAGVGVRPLVRIRAPISDPDLNGTYYCDFTRHVLGNCGPNLFLGVAGEAIQAPQA
jgi:hypothetical protein